MELEAASERGAAQRGPGTCPPPKSCPWWAGAHSKPLRTLPGQIWPRGLKRRPRSSPSGARLPPPSPALSTEASPTPGRGVGGVGGGLGVSGTVHNVGAITGVLPGCSAPSPAPFPPQGHSSAFPSLLLLACLVLCPPPPPHGFWGGVNGCGHPPPPHSLYSHASFLSQDQVRGGWGGTKKISLESGGTGGTGGGHTNGAGGGRPRPPPGSSQRGSASQGYVLCRQRQD